MTRDGGSGDGVSICTIILTTASYFKTAKLYASKVFIVFLVTVL